MLDIRFTKEKIESRLRLIKSSAVKNSCPFTPWCYLPGWLQDYRLPVALLGGETIQPGQYWGGTSQNFTLVNTFQLPVEERPENGYLELNLGVSHSLEKLAFLYGPESLVFIDGQPVRAQNAYHPRIGVPLSLFDGKTHSIVLKGWTGINDEQYQMGEFRYISVDANSEKLAQFFDIALSVIQQRPEADDLANNLLMLLEQTNHIIDYSFEGSEKYYASIQKALDYFTAHLPKAGPSLDVEVAAVGHAHIDVAWLWTVEQTREKAARTFKTALNLLDRNPGFVFAQSQPQLYDFVKHDYPEIYNEIKRYVDKGRWEPIGGMWVEADCNLIGAESFVRQFLLGRQFYKDEFGIQDSPVLWLPDVFGYSWQLPQLMKLAGIDYFVTAKLSWNQYNRIPYDTFWWKGLDGSRVLTQFITTAKPNWWGATYSADLEADELLNTWKGTQHKEINRKLLVPFGQGDGGGGPTQEMIDRGHCMENFPGLPQVKFTKAIRQLQDVQKTYGAVLPEWNGELYLELHRGTYTTQARNKYMNRKCEVLLHDLEFVAAWASVADDAYRYPKEAINRLWKTVCLNQFHDIIPGSAIAQVYEQSQKEYQAVIEQGASIRDQAMASLARSYGIRGGTIVINPTSFERSQFVSRPGRDGAQDDQFVCLPPYSLSELAGQPDALQKPGVFAGQVDRYSGLSPWDGAAYILENEYLHAEFDRNGNMIRLLDREANREALDSGQVSNQWCLFEDRPLDWDAWDIDIFYDEHSSPLNDVEYVHTQGNAHRGALSIKRTFHKSSIEQTIALFSNSRKLEFSTDIHWEERHQLLKVAFPTNLLNTTATYDIQWGNVQRPTHRNTSWEWARFESCAHKWVDLSEGNYGVSLLNDGKYGFNVHGQTIQMSVLRGTTFPDPAADIGDHHFKYALLVHKGDWRTCTIPEAYCFNDDLIVQETGRENAGSAPVAAFFVKTDKSPEVVIETVKRSEDGKTIIVRMYEACRTRGTARITFGFPLKSAWLCNLLEEPIRALACKGRELEVPYLPYEIVSIMVEFDPGGKE